MVVIHVERFNAVAGVGGTANRTTATLCLKDRFVLRFRYSR